jgi:hypothetical protein
VPPPILSGTSGDSSVDNGHIKDGLPPASLEPEWIAQWTMGTWRMECPPSRAGLPPASLEPEWIAQWTTGTWRMECPPPSLSGASGDSSVDRGMGCGMQTFNREINLPLQNAVFWDVELTVRNRPTLSLAHIIASTLKMEETGSSETSVYNRPTPPQPSHRRETLNSCRFTRSVCPVLHSLPVLYQLPSLPLFLTSAFDSFLCCS